MSSGEWRKVPLIQSVMNSNNASKYNRRVDLARCILKQSAMYPDFVANVHFTEDCTFICDEGILLTSFTLSDANQAGPAVRCRLGMRKVPGSKLAASRCVQKLTKCYPEVQHFGIK
ncbi:hypothetical protein AVEN_181131-1 [Araneus ventricosus]|uniref:Uncharacterized protein n=1 Tax=Araneus ventricosus TaxID=182803 RepID=A0A4Y2HKY2_ARAVE|nr:hypothetical protein AVEN_181131-1 [Araneus ventricosus]